MKNKLAFTLIEILIAIAVLSVLAIVTLSILDPIKMQQKAKDAALQEFMKDIASTLELYKLSYGTYPDDTKITELQALFNDESVSVVTNLGNLTFISQKVSVGTEGLRTQIEFNDTEVCLDAPANEEGDIYFVFGKEYDRVTKVTVDTGSYTLGSCVITP